MTELVLSAAATAQTTGTGKVTKKKTSKASSKKKKVSKKKVTKKKVTKKKVKKDRIPNDYQLVIVESPSKAKTIKKYLGRDYQVIACNGHIKDLPRSKLGVDVKKNFNIELVPISGKKDKIERIQLLSKKAKKIFLAPDPDREGEAIAFHLIEEIGRKKNVYRVLFNAVTKKNVQAAIENPTELDVRKYDSQKTRRILDRLVGYKISPILWDKVQRGLSAGRVQSVALRIIVEREDEVRAFVPEQWFSISAELEKDEKAFKAFYHGETSDKKADLVEEKEVNKILADVSNKDFVVQQIKKRERRQLPTPPFTTSKMQQEAANKLGFTAKRTMSVAQRLYEGINLASGGMSGLITYMRTDSVRTDAEALDGLRNYIQDRYGKDFLSPDPITYKRKKGGGKVQDAHEAIRPANLEFSPEIVKDDLNSDEYKLYQLIWNKFISSQMSPAVIDQTSVMFECGGHFFKSTGSIVKFSGFRTVYLESAAEKISKKRGLEDDAVQPTKGDNLLPEIFESEQFSPKEVPASLEHWTSPPPRYSEASLVKELEERGIGRPSTYAAIISNIQDRGYVEKNETRFFPTELGSVVCKMLVDSFPKIMSVDFTAKVEEYLDQIEEGEIKWKKVLKDFWGGFEKTLEKAKTEMKNLKKQLIDTDIKCDKCDTGHYQIKWGKNGQFLACSNYPECNMTQDFKKHLDGKLEIIPKQYAKEPCPECGKRLVVKKGRYGRFLTCETYPECKITLPYTLDVNCPECKVGKFAEKRSRFGKP
ncbi:MAG: type I DNA topoisomerase, partial [Bacteriovoracaceae bacterium]|nr:type I DNA topoisomerase [Bacteriovoracaceae bacterium]